MALGGEYTVCAQIGDIYYRPWTGSREHRGMLAGARVEGGGKGGTWARLVIPSTKQMESRILDFPVPFKPVMALNLGSKFGIVTRVAYDLNPSRVISSMCIFQSLGSNVF